MRVIRVLEYIGNEQWIRNTMFKNAVKDGAPLDLGIGIIQEVGLKFLADDEKLLNITVSKENKIDE